MKIMVVEKVKLEFSEKDLKELIAEKYHLKLESVSISISNYDGDAREPLYTRLLYTRLYVEGQRGSNKIYEKSPNTLLYEQ
jgi:hypothetical protein